MRVLILIFYVGLCELPELMRSISAKIAQLADACQYYKDFAAYTSLEQGLASQEDLS